MLNISAPCNNITENISPNEENWKHCVGPEEVSSTLAQMKKPKE